MSEKELKEYTADEVAKHTKQDSCWLVIGNQSNGKTENPALSLRALWIYVIPIRIALDYLDNPSAKYSPTFLCHCRRSQGVRCDQVLG